MYRPIHIIAPCFTFFLWASSPAQAQQDQPVPDEEARAYVDALYRDQITEARRTRSQEDDTELITEMITRAEQVSDLPRVQHLLLQSAMDLGMSTGVYLPALEAGRRLFETFPEDMPERALLDAYDQAYRGSSRSQRDQIAAPYLRLLADSADRAQQSGALEFAEDAYRKGVSIARTMRSPLEDLMSENLRRVLHLRQVNRRIETLREAVRTNPRNISSARDLTMLLVLYAQDPTAASEFVELTQDTDLIEVVFLSAAGLEHASAADAVRVGDWYAQLADEQPEEHTVYLLEQAVAYYSRFLELYTRVDGLNGRVEGMHRAATERLDAIKSSAQEAARGEWTDLFKEITPNLHLYGRRTQITGGRIEVRDGGFLVPVTPESAVGYDLRMRFQVGEAEDGVVIFMPLNREEAMIFNYSRWEHTRIQIYGGGRVDDARFMLHPGREIELMIQVRLLAEEHIGVVGWVDGEECIRWSGAIDDLEIPEHAVPDHEFGNILNIKCGGDYSFKMLEIRFPEE